MTISFNTIVANLRTPGVFVEIDNSRAVSGTPAQPHNALLVGIQSASSAADELTVQEVSRESDGDALFGRGYMLAEMCRAFRKANPYTRLFAIGIEPAAGTEATGSIAIGGTATAAGTFAFLVGGKRVQVGVAVGATAADVIDDLVAKMATQTDLSVVGTDGTTTLDLECLWAGTSGNDIDVRMDPDIPVPAGLTATVTGMASGATDPDAADIIAALSDEQYHTLGLGLGDNTSIGEFDTELLDRFSGMRMLDGHAFVGFCGDYSGAVAKGAALNSPFVTVVAPAQTPTPPWIVAAVAAAVDAGETERDPSRPRTGLRLPGVLAPAKEDRFIGSERNALLFGGVSTTTVDDGGNVLIERLITTYQTNAASIEDPSYLKVVTMRALSYLRYSTRVRIALTYPRHKLAQDGTRFAPGQAVATPKRIKGTLLKLFEEWERDGQVEDAEQFAADLLVEIDPNDGDTVLIRLSPNLINQLYVTKAQIQFLT